MVNYLTNQGELKRINSCQQCALGYTESKGTKVWCNRTQKCVVNGSLSKVCSLGCGVPQGTILGPLLFLIYINDLPNCLSFCQPRMYADDTHITYASADLHSMQSSLNRDLSNIHKWLLCNKLTLNSTKTEFMLIGSRQKTVYII